MKYLQYLGPSDTFDPRQRFYLDLEDPETEKYVFHAPFIQDPAVPADMRGNVVQLKKEWAEELLTFPGHVFVEVPEEQAKPSVERAAQRRAYRENLARLNAEEEKRSQEAQGARARGAILEGSGYPPLAPGEPTPPERLKEEVKRAEASAKAESNRAGSGGKKE